MLCVIEVEQTIHLEGQTLGHINFQIVVLVVIVVVDHHDVFIADDVIFFIVDVFLIVSIFLVVDVIGIVDILIVLFVFIDQLHIVLVGLFGVVDYYLCLHAERK